MHDRATPLQTHTPDSPGLTGGKPDADVAVVTVIQPELFAALAALAIPETAREKDESGTIYRRDTIRSVLAHRDYHVVVTCIGGAGNPGSAAAVRDLIAWCNPQAVLLMGIAAGIRGKARIGHVVLSDRIVSYEPATVIPGHDGTLEAPRPEVDRLPHAMVQDVVNYRADPERLASLFAQIGGKIPQPQRGQKKEFRRLVASTIEARTATIASGEKLLRDPAKLLAVREGHGKVEVGEMEAAGLVDACRRKNVPWLVVRGISDFGDQFKDDRFHDFAARAAATVLADFLAYGLELGGRAEQSAGARLNGPPAIRPSVPAPPQLAITPRYPDDHARHLSERLEAAYARKKRLQDAGADVSLLTEEILNLRRQFREGGQLLAGDSLGESRYLLLEPIGRGGFATVWRARDRERNETVAVKVLHPNLAGDSIRRDRFLRGARIMAELEHPAIVRVLSPHGEDGRWQYFVMEYVPGGDLRKAALEGRIHHDRAVALILRIGEALDLAHSKGIVHRDVKPANILLDRTDEPKLTDFDLVALRDTTGGTRTGSLGTFIYSAPECLEHPQTADARADVYSLGMTAIFCLRSRELPFDALRNVNAFIENLTCPPAIRSILKQATAWDRTLRFDTAARFCNALRRASEIQVSDLAPHTNGSSVSNETKAAVREYEARILKETLERTNWNRKDAAMHLRMSLRTLSRKVKEFDILPDSSMSGVRSAPPPDPLDDPAVKSRVREYEARILEEALWRTNWNRSEAARQLEMPIRTFSRKVKRFGIVPPEPTGDSRSAPPSPKSEVQLQRTELAYIGDVLASLYETVEAARRIAREAGLETWRIDLTGSASRFWHAILLEAYSQQRIGVLLRCARSDYPENSTLSAAAQALGIE